MAQEQRDTRGVMYRSCEDDHGSARELVGQVDEVRVLVLQGDEEVVLNEGGDRRVSADCIA